MMSQIWSQFNLKMPRLACTKIKAYTRTREGSKEGRDGHAEQDPHRQKGSIGLANCEETDPTVFSKKGWCHTPPSCLKVRLFGPFETPWLKDKGPWSVVPFPFVLATLLGQSLHCYCHSIPVKLSRVSANRQLQNACRILWN